MDSAYTASGDLFYHVIVLHNQTWWTDVVEKSLAHIREHALCKCVITRKARIKSRYPCLARIGHSFYTCTLVNVTSSEFVAKFNLLYEIYAC